MRFLFIVACTGCRASIDSVPLLMQERLSFSGIFTWRSVVARSTGFSHAVVVCDAEDLSRPQTQRDWHGFAHLLIMESAFLFRCHSFRA